MSGEVMMFPGVENDTPLKPEEWEPFFQFLYEIHDHTASKPAPIWYWWRVLRFNGAKVMRA